MRLKIQQMNINIFLNQTLWKLIDCLFYFIQIKITMQKGINPKGIIKKYNVIINGKNFYDQASDSDIKLFEEIRK